MTKITGLDKVLSNLRGASALIAARALPASLAAAGEAITQELRPRIPERTDALAGNVISVLEVDPETSGSVRVGFSQAESADGARFDQIAAWVEYGHSEAIHGKRSGKTVPAHPFMRPAAVAAAKEAAQAFAEEFEAETDAIGHL